MALSNLASWSRIPSVSSPSGPLVSAVVERTDLRRVLFELTLEAMVDRLAGAAVPVSGRHHRTTTGGHQTPHPVHPRPLKARATLARVGDFLEDLVALPVGVVTERL